MPSAQQPPLPARRTTSNSYELLDVGLKTASSTTRKRKKRQNRRHSAQEEASQNGIQAELPSWQESFQSAASSPTTAAGSDLPFAEDKSRLERSFTDISKVHSLTPTHPSRKAPSPTRSPSLTNFEQIATDSSAVSDSTARPVSPKSAAPVSPSKASQLEMDSTGGTSQSLWTYLAAELNPEASTPAAEPFWGQTERQRIYNAILYVPYQLERLVNFGMLICIDSFLAIFTVLPVRVVRACCHLCMPGRDRSPGLQGQQLFDAICVLIFASAVLFLRLVNAGALYFWMKDLTQEFLKLHVIATAVEILDKIACCFVNDSMEALSGTCTTLVSASSKRKHVVAVCMDAGVCWVLVLGHALVLMCQGMAFSVAMNSKRAPALIALVIASNFAEVKGTVFKRFDATKLFSLTCQDVVERFHLMLALAFVLAEEMVSAGHVWPNARLLWQSLHILGAEVVIDVLKHAVLGRFNEIRPGVYREFTFDVSERVQHSQSHNIHRVVSFEPLAPAALFLRILLSFIGSQQAVNSTNQDTNWWHWCCVGIVAWICAALCKVSLGYWLHCLSHAYSNHYQKRYSRATRPPVLRSMVKFAGPKSSVQPAMK